MAAVTICSDIEAQENKVCHCFHCFPIYLPWMVGPDAMVLVLWMLSFKPTFLLFFTFIKRLFSSSSLSAIIVVSSAYLRLLIFLLIILILVYESCSPAFCMVYSAYELNKQNDKIGKGALIYSFPNFEPICCSKSSSNLLLVLHTSFIVQ